MEREKKIEIWRGSKHPRSRKSHCIAADVGLVRSDVWAASLTTHPPTGCLPRALAGQHVGSGPTCKWQQGTLAGRHAGGPRTWARRGEPEKRPRARSPALHMKATWPCRLAAKKEEMRLTDGMRARTCRNLPWWSVMSTLYALLGCL
jgi:hypothetical protein